jgi:predicted nucleic acid-binding protein
LKRYLLDTNVFDALAKGSIQRSDLPSDGRLCATSVQLAELEDTKDPDVRHSVLSAFKEIVTGDADINPGFAPGIPGAGWGQGEWRSDGRPWLALRKDLDEEWERRSSKQKKRSPKDNNLKDAAIAEAALHNGCVLITRDKGLAEVAKKHSIETILLQIQSK